MSQRPSISEEFNTDPLMMETRPFRKVVTSIELPDGSFEEPLGSGFIKGLLGRGGMANVYKIWNTELEIFRAVKILNPNFTKDDIERFSTEMKICAKFHHANIIEVHGIGYWRNLPYIEMELVEGVNLDTVIDKNGALPLEVCTSIGIFIARALDYAHNHEYTLYGNVYHGVIHRDIKPSNIMIDNSGVLKLMDFGIARPIDASIHTTDGSILGTLQYLSPEQLEGKEASVRTDIYSIGTVLYEMVFGIKAFPELNISKLMLSKSKNQFLSVDSFSLKVPSKLKMVINKCMMRDSKSRYASSGLLLHELEKIHASLTSKKPEDVLKEFMASTQNVNKRVSRKRNMVLKNIFEYSTIFLTVLIILIVLVKLTNKQNVRTTKEIYTQDVNDSTTDSSGLPSINNSPGAISHEKIALRVHRQTNQTQPRIQSVLLDTSGVALKADNFNNEFSSEKASSVDLEHLFKMGKYADVITIYKNLDSLSKDVSLNQVLYMRSLREQKSFEELNDWLESTTNQDAEVYLEKARVSLLKGDFVNFDTYLGMSEKIEGRFIDEFTLSLERRHLKALKSFRIFENSPTKIHAKNAMSSWYDLQTELISNKEHPYFKEAQTHIQSIAHLVKDSTNTK